MALQRAERILTQSTRADEVNLEGIGLDSLSPLLPLFAQMTRLRHLKLGRNQLTSLPDDLTVLKNLESLDLSGNPVSGLNAVLRGLLCMPQLKHLSVDLPFESEEDEVIVTLQSLESFNGTSLTDGAGDDEGTNAAPHAAVPVVQQQQQNLSSNATPRGGSHSGATPRQAWGAPAASTTASFPAKTRWDDSDTSQASRLFQTVAQISGNRLSPQQQGQFDELTRNVVGHLSTMQQSTEEDPHKKEIEIMKSKKILFEYCFEEAARGASRVDPNVGQALAVLGEHYALLLNGYDRLVRGVMETKDRKLDALKIDMQNAIQEIESLMHQVETRGSGGGGDHEASARFEAERRRFNEEMGWLKAENERLQTRLRQAELSRQGGAAAGNSAPNARASAAPNATSSERSYGQPSPARTTPPPTIGSKVLTLRQLRDTIEEIYASKSKYDIKCSETHLPRETMEQHMYTYLNQRYGLKHIILEWATAIVQGIKRFSSEDNDVAVFGKILRNEIDEEFRFVQRQLKETVFELLRVYVKGKRPLKVDEEINAIVKKKTAGRITEEEWVDIVKYMYNNEDAVTIIMRIRDVLKQQARPRRAASAAATTRRSITAKEAAEENAQLLLSYNEFIRILLDFQLEGHERFLGRFVRIFKQHDTDRNGILNEHEFRAVLRAVDPTKTDEEVTALLDLIDPHNNQLINFSECVTFLSAELVKMMRDEGN